MSAPPATIVAAAGDNDDDYSLYGETNLWHVQVSWSGKMVFPRLCRLSFLSVEDGPPQQRMRGGQSTVRGPH